MNEVLVLIGLNNLGFNTQKHEDLLDELLDEANLIYKSNNCKTVYSFIDKIDAYYELGLLSSKEAKIIKYLAK